jgi:N utilization substance protein B
VVLQVLYADDANPDRSLAESDQFLRDRLNNEELEEFARSLLAGVRRNRGELDEMLNHCAENWSLSRMAATDRNVLRLGGYEIVFTETPNAVVINEAVDLAKRFGAKHSGKFVNGILDKIAQSQREANGGDPADEPTSNA